MLLLFRAWPVVEVSDGSLRPWMGNISNKEHSITAKYGPRVADKFLKLVDIFIFAVFGLSRKNKSPSVKCLASD